MISNAKIIGKDIAPSQYDAETHERGAAEFTVRSHVLCEVLRNAQRWVRGYVSPESKSKEFGTLFDCLLLTPKHWPRRFAVVPTDAPKKPTKTQLNAKKPSPETVSAIEWWNNWTRDNPGEIVSQDMNGRVHAALARIRESEQITGLLESSAHSVMLTATWQDKSTGLSVPMKALIDIVPSSDEPILGNSLWDLKTTQNASPRNFRMDAQRYGYAVQAAFYLDLWNAASGEERSDFGHVVIENYPPYEFRSPPPLMTQRFIAHGRLLYQRALGIYCKALTSGLWPGYDTNVQGWPMTDCDDWFLAMDTVYEEMNEAPQDEPEPSPQESDVVP